MEIETTVVLSIIVPTYNSESTIKKTIESILEHTRNISKEVIVVDDGSKDDTMSVVSELKNVPDVAAVSCAHAGVGAARNTGIKLSKGKYITFVDSDDLWINDVPTIINESNYSIINLSANVSSTLNNVVLSEQQDKYNIISDMFGFRTSKNSYHYFYGGACSKFYLKKMLQKNKIFFDQRISNSEDILFNINTIINSKDIYMLKYDFYMYISNQNSVTHSVDMKLLDNHIILISILKEVLSANFSNTILFKKIALLYFYQLSYRYFIFLPDVNQMNKYIVAAGLKKQDFDFNELTRPVEKATIFIYNKFGFKYMIQFAKIYIVLKKVVRKYKKEKNQII